MVIKLVGVALLRNPAAIRRCGQVQERHGQRMHTRLTALSSFRVFSSPQTRLASNLILAARFHRASEIFVKPASSRRASRAHPKVCRVRVFGARPCPPASTRYRLVGSLIDVPLSATNYFNEKNHTKLETFLVLSRKSMFGANNEAAEYVN